MNEDYGAITVSGQHVWGIMDTNMESKLILMQKIVT